MATNSYNKRKPYQMSVIFCIQDNTSKQKIEKPSLSLSFLVYFSGIPDSQSKGKRISILLFMQITLTICFQYCDCCLDMEWK